MAPTAATVILHGGQRATVPHMQRHASPSN
jgi:hypothetical protein